MTPKGVSSAKNCPSETLDSREDMSKVQKLLDMQILNEDYEYDKENSKCFT